MPESDAGPGSIRDLAARTGSRNLVDVQKLSGVKQCAAKGRQAMIGGDPKRLSLFCAVSGSDRGRVQIPSKRHLLDRRSMSRSNRWAKWSD